MTDPNEHIIRSYRNYRLAVGITGILLPFLLVLGEAIFCHAQAVRPSISNYYFSGMRDLFVGLLVAIGFFMFFYKYEKKDNIATNIAGVLATGVALFPPSKEIAILNILHFACAGLLFVTFAYILGFLFTLYDKSRGMSRWKRVRNRVYKFCALVIGLCLIVLVLYFLTPLKDKMNADGVPLVFIVETIMLWAFGFGWLVKSEWIMKDE